MAENSEQERLVKDCAEKIEIKLPKNKQLKKISHKTKKRDTRLAKAAKGSNDVYVNKRSNTKALIVHCKKLLDSDAKEIKIHGTGNATCKRAINTARRLLEKYPGAYDLDIQSERMTVIDDLEPTNDDAEYEIIERPNIAVHVRVFPIAKIGPLRFEN